MKHGLYGNMNAYTNLKIKCELFGIRKKGYIEDILETVGLEVSEEKTKHFYWDNAKFALWKNTHIRFLMGEICDWGYRRLL